VCDDAPVRVVVSQYEGIEATPVLPLAAGCLVATARQDPELAHADYAIELERRPIDRAVAALAGADVLGFSLYPWNAAYGLAVAAAAREAYPGALIVAGGPSVPRRPERARRFLDAHPGLDVLVFSEGELAFRELLRARVRGLGVSHIAGLAVRGTHDHHVTAPPERVLDFRETGSPFLDGTFDEVYARHRDKFTMVLCETNRGCPFSCTFCDWSLTKKIVEYPLPRVHAELDWVAARGFRHVMLADANFGIRPRDADLARRLVELKRTTGAPTSFYFYLTKNDHARNLETIEILQDGGIGTWIGLAVQDFDDGVLEAVKRDNIQTGEAQKLRAICGERGIPTFNELILGLPGQTYASFTRTIAEAMPALPRHDFVLFLCRLIDNSELGDAASRTTHALETRRCLWKTPTPGWDPIVDEYQEVVVGTRDLPVADWRRAFRFAFLAAALYNLRLLRVVLQHVVDLGGDPRDLVERLADGMDAAAPGSIYAELGAAFDRTIDSLLAGGPFVLPDPEIADDASLFVDQVVLRRALRRYDEFLTETRAHAVAMLGPSETLDEAFRYQALITPRWRATAPVAARFAHAWPAYAAGGGAPLTAAPSELSFTPPSYAGVASYAAFAATHEACIRARLDIGTITGAGRRALNVLPASG
jgi:radical SAM superfamily enzyme YgiQ (UPF0313 family)